MFRRASKSKILIKFYYDWSHSYKPLQLPLHWVIFQLQSLEYKSSCYKNWAMYIAVAKLTLYKVWLHVVLFSKIISITLCGFSVSSESVQGLWNLQNRLFWHGVLVHPLLTDPCKPAYRIYPASVAAQTKRWFFILPFTTRTDPHSFLEHLWPIYTRKSTIAKYWDYINTNTWIFL